MTEVVSCRKQIHKSTYYPKSVRPNIAKIEYSPKTYMDQLRKIDYFAFGDSFVNMFLHVENAFYIKLKGKSIKGLAKTDKEERRKIQKWVKALPQNVTIIFNFGQVDLNLIRYYKLAHKQNYPEETFSDYINWIQSLKRKTILIGILASPINRDHIVGTLLKYNTLEGVQPDEEAILKEHQRTQDIRKRWNDLMEDKCKENGIRFVNIFKHHKKIDPNFLDQNPKTIHLRYFPCIVELQKHITGLKIDLQKSLQIEQEYVVEKTQRYVKNLQILEEKIKLETQELEAQQTQTDNSGSKDPINDQDNSNKGSDFASQNAEIQSQILQQTQRQSGEECNFESPSDDQENQENQRFIDLLGVQGVENSEKLFERIRQHGNKDILWKIAQRIIELGVFWVHPENYDCCMINFYLANSFTLIRDICNVQQEICTKDLSFQRMIRSKIQETFESNLHSNHKTRAIQDVVTLILFIYFGQKSFGLTLLTEKLMLIVVKEVTVSILKRIISKDQQINEGVISDINSFYKLIREFGIRMNEIFLKKSLKEKIDEPEFYRRFLEILLSKPESEEQVDEKVKQFNQLMDSEYPYALYSSWVLEKVRIAFDLEIDLYERKSLLKLNCRYLTVTQETTLNKMKIKIQKIRQKLYKNLAKISQDSEKKIKEIEQDLCSKCGSLKSLITSPKKVI